MSDSVRPHRRQPTRLPRPWDSAGKNTGVGCHFLLQCMKVKSESEVAQLCSTVSNPMDCSLPGSSVQARVLEWGAIAFSRGYSPPRIEPGLLHCRQIIYHLSHQGSKNGQKIQIDISPQVKLLFLLQRGAPLDLYFPVLDFLPLEDLMKI